MYRIYKGIQENVNKKGPFFKDLFAFCHKYKLYWLRRGFYTPILDFLIFRNCKSIIILLIFNILINKERAGVTFSETKTKTKVTKIWHGSWNRRYLSKFFYCLFSPNYTILNHLRQTYFFFIKISPEILILSVELKCKFTFTFTL